MERRPYEADSQVPSAYCCNNTPMTPDDFLDDDLNTDTLEGLRLEGYEQRLNGVDLYFEVAEPWGAEPDGSGEAQQSRAQVPTLFFLHGGPGYNALTFRELLGERLAQEGWRVIYLDQRGSGRSAALEDSEQGADTLTLDILSSDVEAVREFLADEQGLNLGPLTLLGHGFGALIALEYARRYPQHTARAVVVGPWVHFPELALALLAEASERAGQPLQDPRQDLEANTPEGEYPPVGAARIEAAFALLNARDLLNAMQFKDAPTRMRLEFADAEGQLLGGAQVQQALVNQGLWEFEYPAFLQDITRPIFVIVGRHDRSSFPEQVQWLTDLANADLTVLDAGHYPWLDDEDEFIAALQDTLR